jgi:hypothetical protein
MVIWLSALPLGLYDTCGWATIPLSVVITFLLLGIDEIGVQIEEPFGLLPLDDICDEIEGDLFSMLKEGIEIKKTAQAARLAAMGNQEDMDALDMTPFSPLPRVAVSREEVSNSSMHKEWDEVADRRRW